MKPLSEKEKKMNITYDPKTIIVQEEVKDKDGRVIKEKITLEDHYKTCNGCAYCD